MLSQSSPPIPASGSYPRYRPGDGAGSADPEAARAVLLHRTVLYVLAAILVAISLWSLLTLFRSHALRQELELHQGWIDDMRRVRAELERPVDEQADPGHWQMLEGLRRGSEQILDRHGDPDLRRAASRLASNLELLHDALRFHASSVEPAAAERVWDASFAVLKAASALEQQVQRQMDQIYGRLSSHWRSLNALVLLCLLLCASNLALLQLAHRRRQQLEAARDRAMKLASHDALTGLWNRDAILKMLRRELARSRRLRVPMGLVLLDVDGFREINALLGQAQADVVLQEISWRLGALVRPYDTLGRFGGDSFLVVLPTCDTLATANVAKRLRESVEDREVDYGVGRLEVSLSLAHVTVDRPEDADPDLLIHRLQEALISRREIEPTGAVAAVGAVSAVKRTPSPDSANGS
ncbi:MAG: GGDEF domain-containing protein [Holophagales bacterium]|nr:GGDEF domain-containing protein [Holophagales bacterium]